MSLLSFLRRSGAEGLSFGIMDGLVNVLGILMGLGAMGDKNIVIIGILVASLANSFGNAAGMHVALEIAKRPRKTVLKSTVGAFFSTFTASTTLVLPLAFFDLSRALAFSFVLGIGFLTFLGFLAPIENGHKRWRIVAEYIGIGITVSILSYLLGRTAKGFLL